MWQLLNSLPGQTATGTTLDSGMVHLLAFGENPTIEIDHVDKDISLEKRVELAKLTLTLPNYNALISVLWDDIMKHSTIYSKGLIPTNVVNTMSIGDTTKIEAELTHVRM